MEGTRKRLKERYQLRYAAGMCWLLDMEQDGFDYVKPVSFNTIGGEMWRLYVKGYDVNDIVKEVSVKYKVPEEIVSKDADSFLTALKEAGISGMD